MINASDRASLLMPERETSRHRYSSIKIARMRILETRSSACLSSSRARIDRGIAHLRSRAARDRTTARWKRKKTRERNSRSPSERIRRTFPRGCADHSMHLRQQRCRPVDRSMDRHLRGREQSAAFEVHLTHENEART
jgi:hypothetical protein